MLGKGKHTSHTIACLTAFTRAFCYLEKGNKKIKKPRKNQQMLYLRRWSTSLNSENLEKFSQLTCFEAFFFLPFFSFSLLKDKQQLFPLQYPFQLCCVIKICIGMLLLWSKFAIQNLIALRFEDILEQWK